MAFPVDVRTLVARGCCLVRFSELAFDRFLSITNWSRILPAGSGSLFLRDHEGIIITISIL